MQILLIYCMNRSANYRFALVVSGFAGASFS